LYYRAGYILSTMFVATEISTPFINARWHMHEVGWQGSRAYTVNGVLMVVFFFLCRVAALPWQASACRGDWLLDLSFHKCLRTAKRSA
jgi:hypothetical protein